LNDDREAGRHAEDLRVPAAGIRWVLRRSNLQPENSGFQVDNLSFQLENFILQLDNLIFQLDKLNYQPGNPQYLPFALSTGIGGYMDDELRW